MVEHFECPVELLLGAPFKVEDHRELKLSEVDGTTIVSVEDIEQLISEDCRVSVRKELNTHLDVLVPVELPGRKVLQEALEPSLKIFTFC